jgi:hypothetical protein
MRKASPWFMIETLWLHQSRVKAKGFSLLVWATFESPEGTAGWKAHRTRSLERLRYAASKVGGRGYV